MSASCSIDKSTVEMEVDANYPGFRQQPRTWQDRHIKLTSLGFPLLGDQPTRPNFDNPPTFSTPSRLPHRCLQLLTFQTPPIRRQGIVDTSAKSVTRPGLSVGLETRGTADRSLPPTPRPLFFDSASMRLQQNRLHPTSSRRTTHPAQ